MWPFSRRPKETPERRAIAAMAQYVQTLVPDCADELNESDDKRLAFYAFVFGGISALAMHEGLTPPQAHAIALALFMEQFEMSAEQSAQIAQFCIDSTSRDSPWAMASHSGVDEFNDWMSRGEQFAPNRLRYVLDNAPSIEDAQQGDQAEHQ